MHFAADKIFNRFLTESDRLCLLIFLWLLQLPLSHLNFKFNFIYRYIIIQAFYLHLILRLFSENYLSLKRRVCVLFCLFEFIFVLEFLNIIYPTTRTRHSASFCRRQHPMKEPGKMYFVLIYLKLTCKFILELSRLLSYLSY